MVKLKRDFVRSGVSLIMNFQLQLQRIYTKWRADLSLLLKNKMIALLLPQVFFNQLFSNSCIFAELRVLVSMSPGVKELCMHFDCCWQVSLKAFFGKPGPWFEEVDLDGDKNSIFHDLDGSVTDYKDTYVGRMDNYLIQHPKCINNTEWNGVICSGTYAQASTLTSTGETSTMWTKCVEERNF